MLWLYHLASVRLTRLRRRKLRILRFRLWPKSSVATLLLLTPPNPLRWASAGAPIFQRRSALLPCALRAAPRRRGFSIAVGSALGVRCSENQQDLCNHPTAKFALRWLFYKCYEFVAVGAVQSSPAEAVLSAMNCRKKVVPGFPAKQ